MKVGLVGAGPWAQLFTGPMLAEAQGIDLVGVWARRPEAADALGWGTFTSYDDLLAACDAVCFSVPPDVQATMAAQAAAAGKHVLLDKPIAHDVAGAEALADAVDSAGVISQVIFTSRYTSTARSFLASLSDVVAVNCSFISNAVAEGSVFATPWRVAEPHGLLDLGPHALDLVMAVAGPVADVVASERKGVLSIRLVHDSGVVSNVTLSASTPGTNGPLECVAVTEHGTVVLPPMERDVALAARATVAQEFLAAVTSGTPHPLDVHRGLELQRLMDRVQRAL